MQRNRFIGYVRQDHTYNKATMHLPRPVQLTQINITPAFNPLFRGENTLLPENWYHPISFTGPLTIFR